MELLRFIGGDRHCPTVPARNLTNEDLSALAARVLPLDVDDLVGSGCYEIIEEGWEELENGPVVEDDLPVTDDALIPLDDDSSGEEPVVPTKKSKK